MPVEKYSISLQPDVAAAIALRGDERSTTLNRMIDRYVEILEVGRRKLADLLNDSEIGLILDVLNGTLFAEPFSIQLVDREVADSLQEGYAGKWKCDGPALVEKLRGLTYAEQVAIVDCVERWWERVGRGEDRIKPAEALKPAPRQSA